VIAKKHEDVFASQNCHDIFLIQVASWLKLNFPLILPPVGLVLQCFAIYDTVTGTTPGCGVLNGRARRENKTL
jgi:hypothetical protein